MKTILSFAVAVALWASAAAAQDQPAAERCDALPAPVAKMREAIRAAAAARDYGALAKLTDPSMFTYSFGDEGGDPVKYWESVDAEGTDIRATIVALLDMSCAVVEEEDFEGVCLAGRFGGSLCRVDRGREGGAREALSRQGRGPVCRGDEHRLLRQLAPLYRRGRPLGELRGGGLTVRSPRSAARPFVCAMKSSSASSIAGSSGGGSYCCEQRAGRARWRAGWRRVAPSASHCSKLLLSAMCEV